MSSMQRRKPIFGFGINDADYAVAKRTDPKDRGSKLILCPYYDRWRDVLRRVSDGRSSAYNVVTAGESFRYFSDFRSWAVDLGFCFENKSFLHLDKDILVPGNKEYSLEKCAFVTRKLNNILLTSKGKRGETLLGVTLDKRSTGRYVTRLQVNGTCTHVSSHSNELDAHIAWQLAKAKYIEDSVYGYEKESEDLGIVYRQDIVQALIKRAEWLRECAESRTEVEDF